MDDNQSRHKPILAGRDICIIYDCLFPCTHGGAERWYRCLADQLVDEGAHVTYVTRRQWANSPPPWDHVEVVAVSSEGRLYDDSGTRRTGPALSFGIGTFAWMIRHRREFDAVVIASFPFFSFLGARSALVGTRVPIFVDYHEVWSRSYWVTYAGRVTGTVGAFIQWLCVKQTRFAQVFTDDGSRRLRAMGFQGDVQVLAGLLTRGNRDRTVNTKVPKIPTVLHVGRQVRHKAVRQIPLIAESLRQVVPNARFVITSDGPERLALEADVRRRGLTDVVVFAGPVEDEELLRQYANASCTIMPSQREGYGIVVAESVAAGTPVVVADNPENLATKLVENGVNGYVVEPTVEGMTKGILAVLDAGEQLRERSAEWSERHAPQWSMSASAEEMVTRLNAHLRGKGT